MATLRSPKSGNVISDHGSGSTQSTPDLRTLEENAANITQRKRTYFDHQYDVKSELAGFKREIMSFFQEFSKSQKENFTQIHQNITEIKDEIKGVKTVSDSLVLEQNNIKQDLDNVKSLNTSLQNKISSIEKELISLKTESTSPAVLQKSLPLINENTILELCERQRREKNIIIVGIQEINENNKNARIDYDKNITIKMITEIWPDCPIPVNIRRLGKYVPNKNRPLKVCFESQETPKYLLRNRNNVADKNILIFADQTITQQKYYKQIREELQRRQQNGETNITIKYKNSVPQIVQINTKNTSELYRTPTS